MVQSLYIAVSQSACVTFRTDTSLLQLAQISAIDKANASLVNVCMVLVALFHVVLDFVQTSSSFKGVQP